ncbi:hypothetical protein [Streptomyces sp. NPDC047985]
MTWTRAYDTSAEAGTFNSPGGTMFALVTNAIRYGAGTSSRAC